MKTFFILVFYCICFSTFGQDTLVVRNLGHGFMGVERDGTTTPVFDAREHKAIVVKVPAEVEKGDFLRLSSPGPVDIWWNQQLRFHQFTDTLLLATDTLASGHFTIYSNHGIPAGFSANIVRIQSSEVIRDPIDEKTEQTYQEKYLVIGTLILLLVGFFRRNFTITFYQSFQNPLSYKIRSISVDQNYVGFGSMDNLYSVLFFSCLLSFLFGYLDVDPVFIEGTTFWSGLLNWLVVSILLIALVMAKFLLARAIASLYQIRELPNIQVQDFIHFFTLVASIAVATSFLDFSFFNSDSSFLEGFILYLMIGSIIFFQIWLFFKFDKFFAVRKLMIFSYLCTTEFLPGFLTIYWLAKM